MRPQIVDYVVGLLCFGVLLLAIVTANAVVLYLVTPIYFGGIGVLIFRGWSRATRQTGWKDAGGMNDDLFMKSGSRMSSMSDSSQSSFASDFALGMTTGISNGSPGSMAGSSLHRHGGF